MNYHYYNTVYFYSLDFKIIEFKNKTVLYLFYRM